MASIEDMLKSTLGQAAYSALEVISGSQNPLSGRQIATALGVSPTTANSALGRLRDAGFALSSQQGRAVRWHVDTDHALIRGWLEERRGNPSSPTAPVGMSPYATGGGGIRFEQKVAVLFLTHLLLGDGATELGDGRFVTRVAFQQAPQHSVDDLVIHAASEGEPEASLAIAMAVRRAPNLVQSDDASRKLIGSFLQEIESYSAEGPELRVALVVAGVQDHAKQLQTLADLASHQTDAVGFFTLLGTPGRFSTDVRGRLKQLEGLVRLALQDLCVGELCEELVQQRTWELLSRLTVLMPRLESPDEADWGAITNALIPIARGEDLFGASRLRDRLIALADEYPQNAASIDRNLLWRQAHGALDATSRRHHQGWHALTHLHSRATTSVRSEIASDDRKRFLHIDRGKTSTDLMAVIESSPSAVVVHGEPGVGKSALVIQVATEATSNDPESTQSLFINMRHLPSSTLEFESHLGAPLSMLLAEISAPRRLLVIDGADAISEGMADSLRYVVDSALQADVMIVAITVNESKQLVHDAITDRAAGAVREFSVPPLTDTDVEDVIAAFGELAPLAGNPRSRELLRRPVVVDLLVRGGLSGTPMSDADAMEQIWSGLVRRHGQTKHGTPDARDIALVRLAELALCGGDALTVVGEIDPTALDGLKHDGVLRTSDDPWSIGPEFAHDELRRYAIARLLLVPGNFPSKILDARVPRWSLSAARLACQILLASADTPANPLLGRFARVQTTFNDIVAAGHGERWCDVPGEALLTLGDPGPVLSDAWLDLCAESGDGLGRLVRLVDQRLRDENGVVRRYAVEPLVELILGDEDLWHAEHLHDLLRDWLRALVIDDTPVGDPLRIRLRERILAACAAGDRRMREQQIAAAAEEAARSAEEIEEDRQLWESRRALVSAISFSRTPRLSRRELPGEITDELVVELLALVGPDLGEDGEGILRRVADEAPPWLEPAVEKLLTGRALAAYRRGFLAEMTEAYYLDDEEDGSGIHEDGIRDHDPRSFGVVPLSAWYRGPFMALFQADFRNGVAVLNRMLNHAALARARTLASHQHYGVEVNDAALEPYRVELHVTGERRIYLGDDNVWMWYRGTGVGPFPCMSALQALERVCDQLIDAGIPLANIVAILLDGCECLAMVALAVGLLVRHLDNDDRMLDPYLSEPLIWHYEFGRMVHENSGMAASSEGIAQAERRRWSLREAAMLLVLRADTARAEELRAIGERLVQTYRRWILESHGQSTEEGDVEKLLVTVRSWASGLDKDNYEAHEAEGGIYIQSRPPDDIVRAMEEGNEDLHRAQETARLMVRYHVNPHHGVSESLDVNDLVSDLLVAKDLLENPPALNPTGRWDVPAAVAAAALEAHLLGGVALPIESLKFAAEVIVRVGLGEPSPREYEFEESYFEQGGDRSAARALPLLLMPSAQNLRALIDGSDGSQAYERATSAAFNLARFDAREVRVHLARGFDRIWMSPCTIDGLCHHETGLQVIIESMRDCVLGDWDPQSGIRGTNLLAAPVGNSLAETESRDIYFSRLDAAIRALAPAAQGEICISDRAGDLLVVLFDAHRRALLSYDQDMDSRGTHALIAARALLTVAAGGDDRLIHEHVSAYADNPSLLNGALRAFSAAGEESSGRAGTAVRIWPSLVAQVIGLHETGHSPFVGRHYGDNALASLLPNSAGEVSYLYRELDGDPIVWWKPLVSEATVEAWLPLAQGDATCVDQLIGFLRPLAIQDQVRLGLPWVVSLVLPDPRRVANHTFLLSSWLIEIHQAASDAGMVADWQRVVDGLVVAGVSRLAPYSE